MIFSLINLKKIHRFFLYPRYENLHHNVNTYVKICLTFLDDYFFIHIVFIYSIVIFLAFRNYFEFVLWFDHIKY